MISSPYCASSCRTPSPRRCLASSRCSAPTWPEPDAASNGRGAEHRAPAAPSSGARAPTATPSVNRRIAFSCTCASNRSEPGRVQPLRHRRRGQPAVERADGVVGPHRAGDQQPARVEQPGVAQRLEGVEEGDPAAQRVQRRAVDAALGAGHRPAQHEAVVAGPGRQLAGAAAGRPRASRRRRPAAGRPRRAAAGPAGRPCTISRRSSTWKSRGAVDGGAGPAQPLDLAVEQARLSMNGFQPSRHGQARGSRPARAAIACTAVCTRHSASTSAGHLGRLHLRLGPEERREPVADGDQPPPAAPPGRRGGGLRGHVDLGQRQGQRLRGAHVEARVAERDERRDLAHAPPTSPPSRAR